MRASPMRRRLAILGYTAGALAFLLTFLAGFTQTRFFKDRIRSIVVSNISTRLNGSLWLGTLKGNFLTGFSVDSAAVLFGGDEVVTTGRIDFEHDPLALLEKRLHVTRLSVEGFDVRLRRTIGGEWNVDKLFTAASDTSRGGGDWTVVVDDLELRSGTVSLVDSLSLASARHRDDSSSFEYHNFTLRDLNLSLSATVAKGEIAARIISARAYTTGPDFELVNLKGNLRATPSELSASNLILQTKGTYLEVDARLKGSGRLRGFTPEELEHDSAIVLLTARPLDFSELGLFLPDAGFLKGFASAELDAAGEFGNIAVRRLNVQTQQSSFRLAGTLANLHRPEDLTIDAAIGDSRFVPGDAARLMPSFGLPRFEGVGPTTLFGQFTGTPGDFRAHASLKGNFGAIELNDTIRLGPGRPAYNGTFSASGLNAGKLLGTRDLKAKIDARGRVSGSGFSLDSLEARLSVDIDSAKLQGISFGESHVFVNAFPHRVECFATVDARDMSAYVTGRYENADPGHPSFGAEVAVTSVNLATILGDPRYATTMSFQARLKGSGTTVDDLNADLDVTLLPSTIFGHRFEREEITFTLDQRRSDGKKFFLQSSVADADITGRFDLDLLASTLSGQASNILDKFVRHTLPADAVMDRPPAAAGRLMGHSPAQREMDFTYHINIKNLESVATLLESTPFNAEGTISGAVSGTDEVLSMNGTGSFRHCFFGNIHGGLLFQDGEFSFDVHNDARTLDLNRFSGKAGLAAGSALVNTARIDSLRGTLHYEQPTGDFRLSGIVDTARLILISGVTSVQPQTYVFDVETLSVGSAGYEWINHDDVQVRLNRDGMRVLHAEMRHEESTVTLAGLLSDTGAFDMTAGLRNVEIGPAASWIRDPSGSPAAQGFQGSVSADMRLSGTLRSPRLTLDAAGTDLTFRQSPVGSARLSVAYAGREATIDLAVRRAPADSAPSLSVRGTLPVDLGLAGVEERFPAGEQKIDIVSEGFDIGVLEPLVPYLQNLGGRVTCRVAMTGSPSEPKYAGAISVESARFTFEPNNVAYVLSGNLEPSGENILLRGFSIRNVPEDKPGGELRVDGSISIRNFRIDSFDLRAYGDLLFMTAETRKAVPTMYGTMFAATGDGGLAVRGTLDEPFLTGTLYIRDANIVFPPASNVSGGGSLLSLNYILVEDTVRPAQAASEFSRSFYAVLDSDEVSVRQTKIASEPTLIDRLRYDVSIETQGPTRVKMIFTPSTNEELYAELEGKVSAVNRQGTPAVYGQIAVTQRSYYNFLKKFDASGSLKFVGPWDNPELDVNATYEGTRSLDSVDQKVIVELAITGTRYEPKLVMGMKVQLEPGKEPVDWSGQARGGDVQSDAISFILIGKFKDDLTSQDKQSIASNLGESATSTVLGGVTTSLLSGILTDFFRRELPFVRSAEVTYSGGNFQSSTDLRISGEAFKGYWRFGGKIFNNIGNANVNYQLSLGEVLNAVEIRNLFIELERKVENTEESAPDRTTNAARLYYRISF